MKTKDIMSRVEVEKLTQIANQIAQSVEKINALHCQAREIVGFAETDVGYIEEEDIPFTEDRRELANKYILWAKNNRSRWYSEE